MNGERLYYLYIAENLILHNIERATTQETNIRISPYYNITFF